MTDPVFLFGSFTEDEANSFQSSPLESSVGKKIQPPPKAVKQNGFLPSKPEASAAKQNGHSAAANAVKDSTCRVTANGQAAEIAVDALGQTLGQSPKKRPARPGIAVPVGGGQTAVKHSGGGFNNSVKYVVPKTSKASSTGQNGGLQNSVKVPGGAGKKSSNYTASPPPKAVVPVQNGGVQASVKASGGTVHRSVNRTVSPPPNALVPEENGAGQSSVQASGGAVNGSVNHSTAPTTKVVVPADNGDQADWFVINTLDVSGSKENGEESPSKLGNNNVVKGDPEEQAPVVVSARFESEGVLENDGTGASAEDDTEAVPSKLLPKSWAALVGVPGESKAGSKQVAGVKGKGRGPAGQVGFNKPQLVETVVIPCTALGGETWLTSLREAEVSSRRLQPRGLVNTGNSCFLNSTVQAMLSCSAFTHLLQVLTARSVPQTGYPTLRAFVDFNCEFESSSIRNLTKTRRDGDSKVPPVIDVGKPFAPAMFDTVLQSFTPDQPPRGTGHHRQEDAQEFLSFVIDRMHEEILRLQGKDSPSVQSVSSVTSIEDDDWEMVGPKNRSAVTRTHMFSESAITDIFGGQLRSVVKTKGIKASATVQPFLVLHLDIVPEVVHSVDDALRFFAAPESLEGYKPSTAKVGEVVSASKSVKIQTLPRVLILHLMRFSYGSEGSSKIHKPVQFPLELTLGRELLASTTNSGNEIRKYELVATLSHHGKDPSVGHYTADSKQASGQWLHFDDGVVSGVGVTRVLREQAYVLFYKRAGF